MEEILERQLITEVGLCNVFCNWESSRVPQEKPRRPVGRMLCSHVLHQTVLCYTSFWLHIPVCCRVCCVSK